MTEYLRKHPAIVWPLLSVLIAAGDYLTGPEIQFPVLFLLPVSLATWFAGKRWGLSLAVILPLVRLLIFYRTEFNGSYAIIAANSAIRIAVFCATVMLIDHLVRLKKEVDTLERLLPICSFCKKIRREDNSWTPVESYFTEENKLMFSHGVCPE